MKFCSYILVFNVFLTAFGYPELKLKLIKDETPQVTETEHNPGLTKPIRLSTTERTRKPAWDSDLPIEPPAPTSWTRFPYTSRTTIKSTTEDVESARKRKERRLEMRRMLSGQCQNQEHVRVEDEYGCEMCTCIYERSLMLCAPFECNGREGNRPLEGLNDNVYNDYVINVPTHFSEYKCEPGDIISQNPTCECKCVVKDILSCPTYCQLGRKLQG